MNALKRTPVLNRQCLRNKIEELSPLLQNLNWAPHKDSLFRATWSYYASGCQERLSTIRRRIEQNAKIAAPTGGQKPPFRRDWNPPLSLKESKLPPGGDMADIYQELVSCFRRDEGPAKVKSPPKRSAVQKELKAGDFATLEQWHSWKREEQQVIQAIKQSKDPYLREELFKKLKQLNKLTSRRPLIVLPNQKEISPPEAPKKSGVKKSKRHFESIEPTKQPGLTSKPGPYVNRISKGTVKQEVKGTPSITKLRKSPSKDTGSKDTILQSSRDFLTGYERKHPRLESIAQTRLFFRKFKQSLQRGELSRHSSQSDDISGPYGIDASRESIRNSQNDITSPSKAYDSKSQASEKNLKAKISKSEKPIKSKSSRRNLPSKFSTTPYPSQIIELKPTPKVKNPRKKSTSPDKEPVFPKKPLSLPKLSPKLPKKLIKENMEISENTKATQSKQSSQDQNFDRLLPGYKRYELPDNNQGDKSHETSHHHQVGDATSVLPNSKYIGYYKSSDPVKRKSTEQGRRRMGSIRKSHSWHSSGSYVSGYIPFKANKDYRKNFAQNDTSPKTERKLSSEFSQDQSSTVGRFLTVPGYKPHKIPENNQDKKKGIETSHHGVRKDNSNIRSSSSILPNSKYTGYYKTSDPAKRKSTGQVRHRMGSLRKSRSWHSSESYFSGYVPLKVYRENFAQNDTNPKPERFSEEFSQDQNSIVPGHKPHEILKHIQGDKSQESSHIEVQLDTSSIHSGSGILQKSKSTGYYKTSDPVKRKSIGQGRHRTGSLRMSRSWHSSESYLPGYVPFQANKYYRKDVAENDTNPKPERKLSQEFIQDLSSKVARLLIVPAYQPHKIQENNQGNKSKESSHQEVRQDIQRVRQKSKVSGRRRKRSLRKSRSWYSSDSSALGYIPFKANRDNRNRLTITQPAARESDASKTLSSYRGSLQRSSLVRIGTQHGWPLPIGLQRHSEYVNPFGQYKNKKEEVNQVEKCQVDEQLELSELPGPVESITFDPPTPRENISISLSKTLASDPVSMETIRQNQPLIIADFIAEFKKSYGSKISFKDAYPNLMKPNELDPISPETPLPKPKVMKAKEETAKKKKTKVKKSLGKMPVKCEKGPCSLCNLVRRRQSELRPYMQRMQKQRQRLELKTYYTQKILQKQDSQEERRPYTQQVLARCYQALTLFQGILDQRILQKSRCQP